MARTTIPDTKPGQLDFFEARIDAWTANAADLGLLDTQTTQLASLLSVARSAFDEVQQAKLDLKGLVEVQDQFLAELVKFGSQLVQTIRAFAEQTGSAQVYATAMLEPRKSPEAIPPFPASNLTYTLKTSGALEIKWDGRLSTGTSYILERSIFNAQGQPSAFTAIAFIDGLSFKDETVPHGTVHALYQVRALKGETTTEPTAPIFVRFATGNGQQGQGQEAA